MKLAMASLESVSPYSQSKYINVPKLEKETAYDYEARTWGERCHRTAEGNIFIPPMAFKKSIEIAASFLSMGIKGRGKATYTKHFLAGVMVTDPLILPIKVEEVKSEWLFVPSDGKRGGGKRVQKCFPLIPEWKGDVIYYILDETITSSIFERHLEEAGKFIGIGRFRPQNGGFYGRYKVNNLEWSEG